MQKSPGNSPMSTYLDLLDHKIVLTRVNVFITAILAGVAAAALVFFIPIADPVLRIPFLLYIALQIIQAVLALSVKKPHLRTLGILRVPFDILLTLYWISLYGQTNDSDALFLLPVAFLSLVSFFRLNLHGSALVAYISLFLIIISYPFFERFFYPTHPIPLLAHLVYLFIGGTAFWSILVSDRLFREYSHHLQSKDERIDQLVNTRKTVELAAGITRHDIANLISPLDHLASRIDGGRGDAHRDAEMLKRIASRITGSLSMLESKKSTRIELSVMLQKILDKRNCDIRVPADAYVEFPFMLFISFVQNIHENAQQAFERKHGTAEGFRFIVTFVNGVLRLDDNAGGFDISSIRVGKSTKSGKGHGIFLATFLNDCNLYDMVPGIEKTGDGIRITMQFAKHGLIERKTITPPVSAY